MSDDNQQILEHYLHLLPAFNSMVFADVGIGLFDTEKCLNYIPGKKMNLGAKPGDPVKPGSGTHQAIQTGQRVVRKVDKAVYGRPYVVVAVPIVNAKNEIIGAVAVSEPTDKIDEMKSMSGKLADNINTLASTTQEIAAQTEEIAATSRTLAQSAAESKKRTQETDDMINLIKTVAGQTNLLGLNAAIEAARVGEQGRGFGVVAEEIRKLAATSTNSLKRIDEVIKNIQLDSEKTVREVGHIDTVIAQVAGALDQVAGAVQEIRDMVINLDRMADSLADE